LRGVTMLRENDFTFSDRATPAYAGRSLHATSPEGTWRVGLYRFQEARSLTGAGFFFVCRFLRPDISQRRCCSMLLPDRLNQRIAEAITHQINTEREQADTSSPVWRERCEVARVAMFSDAERSVFISHISERRGSAAAREMQSQAETLRTNAIFFLARKPS